MAPIRILIVDDHPAVQRGLRELLSSYPDIVVVGTADDGPTALRAAAELQPDVMLLDILLPGIDGVEIALRLRREAPDAKIVVLTAFDNQKYVLGALRAGARAYLLKTTSDETVVETVRLVHQGKRLLSPPLMDKVLEQFEALAERDVQLESGLSDDELQVLKLVSKGATNADIVTALHWSQRTVKRRLEDAQNKLGAKNRTHAVVEAIKKGLI